MKKKNKFKRKREEKNNNKKPTLIRQKERGKGVRISVRRPLFPPPQTPPGPLPTAQDARDCADGGDPGGGRKLNTSANCASPCSPSEITSPTKMKKGRRALGRTGSRRSGNVCVGITFWFYFWGSLLLRQVNVLIKSWYRLVACSPRCAINT